MSQPTESEQIDQMLFSLGYRVVPDAKVSQATNLILTYTELHKLSAAINALLTAARDEYRVDLITNFEQGLIDARIEELQSLDHNKQMFGDWQQVIADRIKELSALPDGEEETK